MSWVASLGCDFVALAMNGIGGWGRVAVLVDGMGSFVLDFLSRWCIALVVINLALQGMRVLLW